jgi:hypothetical protein
MSTNKKSSSINIRSQLDAFFTPGPKAQTKRGADLDPENPVDIYNHTHKFFKASKKTDEYAKTVEVGERRIRPAINMDDLDLDQKIYGGKRVSRENMNKQMEKEDEDDEEIDSEEYGSEEDGDDDMEEGEEDLSEEEEEESHEVSDMG